MTTETQDAILQRLHAEWMQEHPAGRPRLAPDVVAELAWRLIAAHLQPTVERIRNIHGGGSPNVIHPALRAFFAGELQRRFGAPAPAPGVPAPLFELWTQALRLAGEAANARVAAQHAELERREQELSERQAPLDARASELDRREEAMTGELGLLRRAAQRADAERDAVLARADQAAQQLSQARALLANSEDERRSAEREASRLPAVEAELAAARADAVKSGAYLVELTRRITSLEGQLKHAEQEVARERERAINAAVGRDEAIVQAAQHRAALGAEIQRQAATQQLLDAVHAQLAEQAGVAAELATARQALAEHTAQLAAVTARRDAEQAELASLRQRMDSVGRLEEAVGELARQGAVSRRNK